MVEPLFAVLVELGGSATIARRGLLGAYGPSEHYLKKCLNLIETNSDPFASSALMNY